MSGNAFSVPVVTHAFRQVLDCFITPPVLGFPDVPHWVHRSRDPKKVVEILHRAEMLNLERSSLAIFGEGVGIAAAWQENLKQRIA